MWFVQNTVLNTIDKKLYEMIDVPKSVKLLLIYKKNQENFFIDFCKRNVTPS